MYLYVLNIILSLIFIAVSIIMSPQIPIGYMPILVITGIAAMVYSIYKICQINEKIKGIILGIIYSIF